MSRAPFWLALLVILVYARALGGGPVYDDENILLNTPRIVTAGVRLAFTSDFWGEPPEGWRHMHYRPLAMLAYSAIYRIFGLSPFAFHAAAILLHAAATIALYYLARALGYGDGVAAVAGAIFGVHPLNVEAVAWMSGLSEVLSGAAVLASLALFAHRRTGLSLIAAAIAMLTKEMSLALPLLICLLAQSGREAESRPRQSLLAAAPFAALALVYLAARAMVIPPPPPGRVMQAVLEGFSIMAGTATHYFIVLFAPWPLAIHYAQPSAAVRIAGLAIAAAWLALAWWKKEMFFAAALGMIPLAIPIVHATIMIEVLQMPDRNVYLAVAGAALSAGLLLERLPRPARLSATALVVVLAAALSVRQAGVWKNAESLWSHALDVTPTSKPAAQNLGFLYVTESRFQDAARVYRYALLSHPGDPDLLKRLADVEKR